jgi:hypothetical protein
VGHSVSSPAPVFARLTSPTELRKQQEQASSAQLGGKQTKKNPKQKAVADAVKAAS